MKESATHVSILEEGATQAEPKHRADEARRILLRLGNRRFGAPDAQAQAALEAIDSVDRLEQLADRILEVESWSELLE